MEDLSIMAEEALNILQDLEERREIAIKRSREIIRETKRIIHSIHTGGVDAEATVTLKNMAAELSSLVSNDPNMATIGLVEDAFMEYAEAIILRSIMDGNGVPSFGELDISPRSWVLGLADCLGELRRVLLDLLMSKNTSEAESVFSKMEGIYQAIMMFDVPEPLLPIRRKQDVARGIMERTRTDLTHALMLSNIRV